MISTDDITITAVSSGKDLPVSVDDSGVVTAGGKTERFKFQVDDFKGGFRVGKAYDLTDKKEVRALIRTDRGDNWEVVNCMPTEKVKPEMRSSQILQFETAAWHLWQQFGKERRNMIGFGSTFYITSDFLVVLNYG
ncbi:hypothetical protein GLOTRDRAFT_127930 [Gloeophyllum trabeum ATCC 11539]|uniref:Uncharacterized protein n=1 Tax=Gloeophyllum trabeum (strain ATCC 11539 / FP-39264 / Madison 617) TaxID=670483 RepID=S7QDV2_GLOTA|nr:uncharacterized protein GLOTRDRAFT_127930 [Gloeophyllum trabeum ATCC 11539]EPQ57577.1 hypothetical protein GLOTRDRAFT_127930 [Gloeophyllum trabeum ATCC 11539]